MLQREGERIHYLVLKKMQTLTVKACLTKHLSECADLSTSHGRPSEPTKEYLLSAKLPFKCH